MAFFQHLAYVARVVIPISYADEFRNVNVVNTHEEGAKNVDDHRHHDMGLSYCDSTESCFRALTEFLLISHPTRPASKQKSQKFQTPATTQTNKAT